MYIVYAWKSALDTPFMRKKVHRLCVENLRDSHWNVNSAGELRQPIRLGLEGVVGGKAATANIKARADDCRRGRAQLILAGQVNDVVGEVEFHFVNWEVRERDLLRVDWVPIAVVAEHGRATVGMNLQVPDLEFFG